MSTLSRMPPSGLGGGLDGRPPTTTVAKSEWAEVVAGRVDHHEDSPMLPRPGLPVARLLNRAQDRSAYYVVTTVDARGRLSDSSPLRVLRWGPDHRFAISQPGDIIVVTPIQKNGCQLITRRRYLRLPAPVRHRFSMTARERLLLAAYRDRDMLVVFPPAALDTMIRPYCECLAEESGP